MANSNAKAKATATKDQVVAKSVADVVNTEAPIVPKEIDLNQLIPVYNGFNGKLIYKSSRTGEAFRWPEFGSEQEIELRELRNAKNTGKTYFENNWFMFNEEDKWVIDYLGVGRYYKYAINIDEFDEVFGKSADEIEKIVSKLSNGQKKSLSYRARQFVADGTIDSRKVIAALEKSLGVELIEK